MHDIINLFQVHHYHHLLPQRVKFTKARKENKKCKCENF